MKSRDTFSEYRTEKIVILKKIEADGIGIRDRRKESRLPMTEVDI